MAIVERSFLLDYLFGKVGERTYTMYELSNSTKLITESFPKINNGERLPELEGGRYRRDLEHKRDHIFTKEQAIKYLKKLTEEAEESSSDQPASDHSAPDAE